MGSTFKVTGVMACAGLLTCALLSLPARAQERLGVPDIIFIGGKIYTGEPHQFVEAVAVKDGNVLAVGTTAAMRALATPRTRVEDLHGKTTLPGFFDNHVHAGVTDRLNMSGKGPDLETVHDLADLQKRLKAFAATLPADGWIIGEVPHGNGSFEPFPEGHLPTRYDLDAAVPDHPIVLTRGAHITLVNSKTLALIGVDKSTPQLTGGAIDRDAKGEATGVFREAQARRLAMSKFPTPKVSDAQALEMMRSRLKEQLPLGVTSLNIPSVRPKDDFRWLEMLYAKEADTLPRVTAQLRVYPGYDTHDDVQEGVRDSIAEIENFSLYTGFGNDRLRIGAIKMSVDGAFGGQAAWLKDSYVGRPGYHGIDRIPPDALYAVAKRAYELGWQIGVHAIGDQAVEETVKVFDRILKENPRPDARLYLHHISVRPSEETLQMMKRDGILAAMQPNFTFTIAPYYAKALSPEKQQTNNDMKTMIEHGIPVSIGSDHLPDGPLIGIYGAVTRHGIDGKVYGPDRRLTLEQALYAATVGSAYLTFNEKTRGLLKPGMVADMVVLDNDIFTIDPERIKDLKVLKTIIGGKTVWDAAAPPAAAEKNREVTPAMMAALTEERCFYLSAAYCEDDD